MYMFKDFLHWKKISSAEMPHPAREYALKDPLCGWCKLAAASVTNSVSKCCEIEDRIIGTNDKLSFQEILPAQRHRQNVKSELFRGFLKESFSRFLRVWEVCDL